jgi:hypothetical protein
MKFPRRQFLHLAAGAAGVRKPAQVRKSRHFLAGAREYMLVVELSVFVAVPTVSLVQRQRSRQRQANIQELI